MATAARTVARGAWPALPGALPGDIEPGALPGDIEPGDIEPGPGDIEPGPGDIEPGPGDIEPGDIEPGARRAARGPRFRVPLNLLLSQINQQNQRVTPPQAPRPPPRLLRPCFPQIIL